jgi:Na+/melibiose symporter-like transporter
MKKYTLSIIYIVLLCVLNFFHYRVEKFLFGITGEKFLSYFIYALFISFSLLLLLKVIPSKKNLEFALVLLIMGFIFFLFLSRSPFLVKLNILEFFVLGVLIAIESKKAKSFFPFFLLIGAAFLIEAVSNFSTGSSFYYFDVWINSLTALSGYISFALLL